MTSPLWRTWTFPILLACMCLAAAMLIAALGDLQRRPRVVEEWEDGSGLLSDGRSFCIAGEPCDDANRP